MTSAIDPTPEEPKKEPVRPQPVVWASQLTVAWGIFTVLTSLSLFSERAFLRKSLVDNNAKAKNPVADLTGAKLDRAVHSALVGGTAQSILMLVILVLLAMMLMRGRGWARWTLIAFATVLPILIGVGVGVAVLLFGVAWGDSPLLYRVPLVAAGLCSLGVLILLSLPETSRYFNALRPPGRRGLFGRPVPSDANAARVRPTRPTAPGSVGGAERRPGSAFGALFAPRRTAAPSGPEADVAGGAPSSGSTAVGPAAPGTATRPGRIKAKGTGSRPGRSKSRQQ